MGRPSHSDGRQTRQAILDTALQLFAEKGYFGTTLRDIAAGVEVRESALYNYFPSKEALFDMLMAADYEEKMERFSRLSKAPIDDVRSALERLAGMALEHFSAPRQQQLFRMLMADGLRLAKDGRINLIERMNSGLAHLRDLMARLIAEGWIRDTDPDVLVIAFMGPLLMWRHFDAIRADHPLVVERDAFARSHVEQFLRGAAGRPLERRPPLAPRAGSARPTARRARARKRRA
jgi:AcrR family transcriptional regulator